VSGAILLSVAIATWFAARRPDRSDGLGSTLFLLLSASWIALFFASELSFPIWIMPTPLRMLQFPHRFIYIASATGTLANLLILGEQLRLRPADRSSRALAAFPLLLAIALTGALEVKFILVDAQHLNLSPDDRAPYNGLAEYKPRNVGDAVKSYEKGGYAADCRRERLACGPPVATGDREAFQIVAPAREFVRLPVFAFPAWSETVNGTPAAMRTDSGTGVISLLLPKGRDDISLVWRRLPQEQAGIWLSLLSVAAAIFLASRRGEALLRF